MGAKGARWVVAKLRAVEIEGVKVGVEVLWEGDVGDEGEVEAVRMSSMS